MNKMRNIFIIFIALLYVLAPISISAQEFTISQEVKNQTFPDQVTIYELDDSVYQRLLETVQDLDESWTLESEELDDNYRRHNLVQDQKWLSLAENGNYIFFNYFTDQESNLLTISGDYLFHNPQASDTNFKFASQGDVKESLKEIFAKLNLPYEFEFIVTPISAEDYQNVVEDIENLEPLKEEQETQPLDLGVPEDFYHIQIRALLNGIPHNSNPIGEPDQGAVTAGQMIEALYNADGLQSLVLSGYVEPGKIIDHIEVDKEALLDILTHKYQQIILREDVELSHLDLYYYFYTADEYNSPQSQLKPLWLCVFTYTDSDGHTHEGINYYDVATLNEMGM